MVLKATNKEPETSSRKLLYVKQFDTARSWNKLLDIQIHNKELDEGTLMQLQCAGAAQSIFNFKHIYCHSIVDCSSACTTVTHLTKNPERIKESLVTIRIMYNYAQLFYILPYFTVL